MYYSIIVIVAYCDYTLEIERLVFQIPLLLSTTTNYRPI